MNLNPTIQVLIFITSALFVYVQRRFNTVMAPVKRRMGSKKSSTSLKKEVLAIINANRERKCLAVTHLSNGTLSATGSSFRVSGGIIQGDASTQRDGSQITVERLDVFFRLTCPTAATNARILVVQDKQANAADMTLTSLLNAAAYYEQYHPEIQSQQKRFHILLDKHIGISTSGEACKNFKFSLRPLKTVNYQDSTDVSTACGKNFIWIWVIGDQATTTYALSTATFFYDS